MRDDPETIRAKVRTFITDPLKVRMGDPGRPEICPIFAMHHVFSPAAHVEEVASGCRAGTLGCVADKTDLADRIIEYFRPYRERREQLEADPGIVQKVLIEGADRARPIAQATLESVRSAMGFP